MPARRAGPKAAVTGSINLSGCPDPNVDLLAARLWVLENILNVRLRGWQLKVFKMYGGNKRPRLGYIQVPRKNGKSFLMACFVLTEIILKEDTHCYAISDSEKNLASVLFREIESIIYKAQLDSCLLMYAAKIENPTNNSFLELRASNFAASQGINPSLVLFDEVHLQKDDRIWNGMLMSCAARDDGLLLGVTTPGYDLSSLAHSLYQKTRKGDLPGIIIEPPSEEFDYKDVEIWKLCNPCYEEQASFLEIMAMDLEILPEHEFRRFRLGQWTASEGAWLPYGAWGGCETYDLQPTTGRCWIGFDGSYSGDSTAAVLVDENLQVRVLGVWENPGDKEWRVPRDEVHSVISKAMHDYPEAVLLCDPPYWQREISEWSTMFRGRVMEFPTGSMARMAPACTALYAAILEGRIKHDGDPRLAKHLANARIRPTQFGDTIVKDKEWSPAKIDAAVALAIAVAHADRAVRVRHPAGAR